MYCVFVEDVLHFSGQTNHKSLFLVAESSWPATQNGQVWLTHRPSCDTHTPINPRLTPAPKHTRITSRRLDRARSIKLCWNMVNLPPVAGI